MTRKSSLDQLLKKEKRTLVLVGRNIGTALGTAAARVIAIRNMAGGIVQEEVASVKKAARAATRQTKVPRRKRPSGRSRKARPARRAR